MSLGWGLVNQGVLVAVLAATALVALAALVQLVRDQPVGDVGFAAVALTEAALAVQLVLGLVLLAAADGRDVSAPLFVSYLLGSLVALPVGAAWSLAERTRSGTVVVLLAALTVAALEARLVVIWGGVGA